MISDLRGRFPAEDQIVRPLRAGSLSQTEAPSPSWRVRNCDPTRESQGQIDARKQSMAIRSCIHNKSEQNVQKKEGRCTCDMINNTGKQLNRG